MTPPQTSDLAGTKQSEIDMKNSEFWNNVCGTAHARALGVTDASATSLKRFDDWFFDFYPYLAAHIPFDSVAGKRVLEVGLGYGSVAQRLAEGGAHYTGLDIAQAPVDMTTHRMQQNKLTGRGQQGSILAAPFEQDTFDLVVSIGCLHHTGDLQKGINEVHRILKPGGTGVVMVYNALSYRRWMQAEDTTRAYYRWSLAGEGNPPSVSGTERATYDSDTEGNLAPETTFVSVAHLKRMCSRFANFKARLENIDQEPPIASRPRTELLKTEIPQISGLDIYATMVK